MLFTPWNLFWERERENTQHRTYIVHVYEYTLVWRSNLAIHNNLLNRTDFDCSPPTPWCAMLSMAFARAYIVRTHNIIIDMTYVAR